uniref:Diphthine--ammonia ligase n=1 Tax=Chromera velia CCMP2878 TaxID=1169474 RepID=A0A0G4HZF7_9ALVE|eukprot:Cvel_9721.t1-p1 / transcript=Cvel_9721.t1 / gene=Cvel_9721 / organism=Chromera_velia_CCMP2878 / gene_product=Uncharacterized protein MJ0570, putative / transcript_product=Uncharacterized protein MJ0570, putative / location=Cvel_scaffold568:4371-5138(+) / protein_length=256 / sequence_SO=supercontig / SO=protein_coding / is_pseudo=false
MSMEEASRSRGEKQQIQEGADYCAVSWTGGKDCNLALLSAWRDPSLHVVALVVFRPEDAQFRAHPLKVMEAQATSLGLPLLHVVIPRDASSYKEEYVKGLRMLRDEHGISVIATGDMDLVGSMERNWIDECAEAAGGMRAFLPLWKADRRQCLERLIAERFRVVFSCVKSPWFHSGWVGRVMDSEALRALQTMQKEKHKFDSGEAEKTSLDLGGERGEYHTMCVDGPLYAHPVEIQHREPPLELVSQPGQREGEQW